MVNARACVLGANIFVSSSGLIKLGDFGSAVRLKDPVHTMQGEVCKFRGTAGMQYALMIRCLPVMVFE